jgi:hypothetical protein
LNVVTTFDIFAFRNAVVCPYSTSFTVSGSVNSISSLAFKEGQGPLNAITFIGISVEAAAGVSGFLAAKGVAFYACRFVQGAGSFFRAVLQESGQSYIYFDQVGSALACIDCYLGYSYFKASPAFYGNTVVSGGVYYPLTFIDNARFITADFESAGGGTAITLGYASAGLQLGAGITVDPALAGFINCSSSQNAGIRILNNTVTGSVTGNAVVLTNGAQAIGLEAACSGNLTAGGSEIVVGGNAGQTFASLPATDLAAASPQLCRAT